MESGETPELDAQLYAERQNMGSPATDFSGRRFEIVRESGNFGTRDVFNSVIFPYGKVTHKKLRKSGF